MDDGGDGEAHPAHPRGNARQTHRMDGVGDVERLAFVEDQAGVGDARSKTGGPQALAQRAAASRRAHAHGQQVAPAGDAPHQVHLPARQLRVEEHQRRRARTDDRHHLLYRGYRIGFPAPVCAEHAKDVGRALAGQIGLAVAGRRARDDAAVRDEGDLLVGYGSAAAETRGVVEAHAQGVPVRDDVGRVDAPFRRRPFLCGWGRQKQAGHGKERASQKAGRHARKDDEIGRVVPQVLVEPLRRQPVRQRRNPDPRADARHIQSSGGIGERGGGEHRDLVRGIAAVAEERRDRRGGTPVWRHADKPRERPTFCLHLGPGYPEHLDRQPLAQFRQRRDEAQRRSRHQQVDPRRGGDLPDPRGVQVGNEPYVHVLRCGCLIHEGGEARVLAIVRSFRERPRRKRDDDDQHFHMRRHATDRGHRSRRVVRLLQDQQHTPIVHVRLTTNQPASSTASASA